MTLPRQRDVIEIPAENLRSGDELEVGIDVFWTVVDVEETHVVHVELVHDRRFTYRADDRVRILRSKP